MTAAPLPRIGILGGTLDPIHNGHLDTACAARAVLGLQQVVIMPSRVPPHRPTQPHASGYHRFAMAALAVAGIEGLTVSDAELCAPPPSYTADTLERLHRDGLLASQIFFITGADAFAEIETWSRFPGVLDLAHFVVVSRPGVPAESMRTRLPRLAPRMRIAESLDTEAPGPAIFLLDVPTPDVSSTAIRQKLAGGEALAGDVPAAVEAHILRHKLYSPTSTSSAADHLHG